MRQKSDLSGWLEPFTASQSACCHRTDDWRGYAGCSVDFAGKHASGWP
jgi:hypothetical protein